MSPLVVGEEQGLWAGKKRLQWQQGWRVCLRCTKAGASVVPLSVCTKSGSASTATACSSSSQSTLLMPETIGSPTWTQEAKKCCKRCLCHLASRPASPLNASSLSGWGTSAWTRTRRGAHWCSTARARCVIRTGGDSGRFLRACSSTVCCNRDKACASRAAWPAR